MTLPNELSASGRAARMAVIQRQGANARSTVDMTGKASEQALGGAEAICRQHTPSAFAVALLLASGHMHSNLLRARPRPSM
jgi:hypothetical protein